MMVRFNAVQSVDEHRIVNIGKDNLDRFGFSGDQAAPEIDEG